MPPRCNEFKTWRAISNQLGWMETFRPENGTTMHMKVHAQTTMLKFGTTTQAALWKSSPKFLGLCRAAPESTSIH